MGRYRKMKKVSWAPDVNLCQIRQFSSEDCPSKVGLKVADNMQFKQPHKWQSSFASNNPSAGFLRTIMKKPEKLFSIPSIKWKCPPKVELNPNWLVAAGEQSEEVGFQTQREMKVFEAVYPRLSNIPYSPAGALCKDEYLPDDHITPTIRTTPIEDDEAAVDSSSVANPTLLPVVSACQPSELIKTSGCVNSVQTTQAGGIQEMISSTEADLGAAASAALTALLKSNEIGNSIDPDFLIDILNSPKTVSMLLNMTSSASTKPTPEKVLPSVNFSVPPADVLSSTSAPGKWGGTQIPTNCASAMLQPRYVTDNMISAKSVASPPTSIGRPVMTPSPLPSFRNGSQLDITHEVPTQITFTEIVHYNSSAAVNAKLGPPSQVKDANYFKNLIKRHGLDNQTLQGKIPHTQQRSHESVYPDYGLPKNGQKVTKNSRPCAYYNTPRGCRRGVECPFRHDIKSSYQMPAPHMSEVPNAKRMKMGRSELTNMT